MSSEGPDRKMEATPGTCRRPELLESVASRRRRIERTAQRYPNEPLTALNQHLDLNWLHEAYRRVRKDAAAGVDGQTVEEYGEKLTENLRDLQNRVKSGRYKAPPVRRVQIPKNEKETRPIGIPTAEDKILQHAVAMIVSPIYELEFQPFSYGFRPGRSPHQAIKHLRERCHAQGVEWILEVDLRRFFDTVNHRKMEEVLGRRVGDGVLRTLIGKWLRAGVMEKGQLSYPEEGTPQGGVISPLLANIYLHEVLDTWFIREIEPVLKGRGFMVRYADDFIMGFSREEDARRVLEELEKRFTEYGLEINAEKTRMVPFKRPGSSGPKPGGKPGTFDYLGFTLYWGRTRKGGYVVKVKTASKRFTRTLDRIREWCRENRHRPVAEQRAKLNEKLRGHDAYYGMSFNARMLENLRYEVCRIWKKWLNRRSKRESKNWKQFNAMLETLPLARPRILHSLF